MRKPAVGIAMFIFLAGTPGFAFEHERPKPPEPPAGPRGITQQGTDPDGQACTPAGYNANTSFYPPCEAGSGGVASTATPPRCSKTVKDHCVQAYERGVRR